MKMSFLMPMPPSLNGYWRAISGRNILSRKGRQYQKDAIETIEFGRSIGTIGQEMIMGDVKLTLVMHFANRRRRDIDNYVKVLQDALTKAGVWHDDCQVSELHVYRGCLSPIGRVEVEIETL